MQMDLFLQINKLPADGHSPCCMDEPLYPDSRLHFRLKNLSQKWYCDIQQQRANELHTFTVHIRWGYLNPNCCRELLDAEGASQTDNNLTSLPLAKLFLLMPLVTLHTIWILFASLTASSFLAVLGYHIFSLPEIKLSLFQKCIPFCTCMNTFCCIWMVECGGWGIYWFFIFFYIFWSTATSTLLWNILEKAIHIFISSWPDYCNTPQLV